ncbi:MAG TPA: hypothetical protein VF095_08845 [Bacillota bacterium]
MKALKQFFKIRETYVGIAATLAYQIIFFSVWLTAYDGVFERTDQLKVALVNEDARLGEVVSKAIEEKVPFDSLYYSATLVWCSISLLRLHSW